MAMEATHTTIKNAAGAVTHYDIKVDGAIVGTATKTDKGLFNFKTADGAGQDLSDMKTMRDLKVEVLKNVPKAYVEANKPTPAPKREPKAKAPTGNPADKPTEADEDGEESEDIDLA